MLHFQAKHGTFPSRLSCEDYLEDLALSLRLPAETKVRFTAGRDLPQCAGARRVMSEVILAKKATVCCLRPRRPRGSISGFPLGRRSPKPRTDECGDGANTRNHK
jgi:hypothetical protein